MMEVTAESLKKLNLTDLCSVLGYEKDNPTRDSQGLMAAISSYLEEYEAKGTPIPPNETLNPITAQECACSFLIDQDRAERFWPPSGVVETAALVWDRPEHRSIIIMAVTYLFRRRAFYNYQSRLKREKREVAQKGPARRTGGKRPRSLVSYEESSDSDDEAVLGGGAAFNLAPGGTQHPQRFGRKRCIQYLRSIDPRNDTEILTDFTIKWLAKADYPWPPSADTRMQRFMHEQNFYFSVALREDLTHTLINELRRGTELEIDISGSQYSQFSRRVVDQIEYATKQLTRNRFLEYELDGTPKRTKRFQRFWDAREEVWKSRLPGGGGSAPPPKRRKTAKPARPPKASPITFPNLMREPVGDPSPDLRLMAISAQVQMIQNAASTPEMGAIPMSADVRPPASPGSHAGDSIIVEAALSDTTSSIELLSPAASRASTCEIAATPGRGAESRFRGTGAGEDQDPSTPDSEHRTGEGREEDVRPNQGESDPGWAGTWPDARPDDGPLLRPAAPAGPHGGPSEAQPARRDETRPSQPQPAPFGPEVPPLGTVPLPGRPSSASAPQLPSRLVGANQAVPLPAQPPAAPTRPSCPSPRSPSSSPLFPHETMAQYERDLASFRERCGTWNAGPSNPPPCTHTPSPPFPFVSTSAMQAPPPLSGNLSPNAVRRPDNNVQVPPQGFSGAQNSRPIHVPGLAPPTPSDFQTPPAVKDTRFIQDPQPTFSSIDAPRMAPGVSPSSRNWTPPDFHTPPAGNNTMFIQDPQSTFSPINAPRMGPGVSPSLRNWTPPDFHTPPAGNNIIFIQDPRSTFSPINAPRMAPPAPGVSPSPRSWTSSNPMSQSHETRPCEEQYLRGPNYHLPSHAGVQNIARNPPFPPPQPLPQPLVLESQRGPSVPGPHAPSPYHAFMHTQQLHSLPPQIRAPHISWARRSLPSGPHQNPPIPIQGPGNPPPPHTTSANNSYSHSTPLTYVSSNSTNRENLQSHPARLNSQNEPQEPPSYPSQIPPKAAAQESLPSAPTLPIQRDGNPPTIPGLSVIPPKAAIQESLPSAPTLPIQPDGNPPAIPGSSVIPPKAATQKSLPSAPTLRIQRDGTPPTLPYPSEISLKTGNQDSLPQTPIHRTQQNETLPTPPQNARRPCGKPSPAREQMPSRGSVESETQGETSTTPPHMSSPEQLPGPCRKLSLKKEQTPSRESTPSRAQREDSPTLPRVSSPEQPPRSCRKLSPKKEQTLSRESTPSRAQRKDSPTLPRASSPEQLPESGGWPFLFRLKPLPFSIEPTEEEEQLINREQESTNSTKLSTDTQPGRPLRRSPAPELEAGPKLNFIGQNALGLLNWTDALPSDIHKESNVEQVFETYAKHAGVPLSTLTTLTFITIFGDQESLVVHRGEGEGGSKTFKKRLNALLIAERENPPDDNVFEVWVKFRGEKSPKSRRGFL